MGLELADTGFDASVLSEFRARLAVDDQAERLLQQMLARLRERGCWSRAAGSAPTPPTCWPRYGSPGRLELVTETLRAALEALAAAAPSWLITLAPDDWYERYGQRARDWRLPKAEAARAALAVTVGTDGFALLEAVHDPDAPGWLWQVPAIQILRAVWVQQYYRDQDGLRWRGRGSCQLVLWRSAAHMTPMPATGSSAGWAGAATRPTSPNPASPTGPT